MKTRRPKSPKSKPEPKKKATEEKLLWFKSLRKEAEALAIAIQRERWRNNDGTKIFISRNLLEKIQLAPLLELTKVFEGDKIKTRFYGLEVFTVIEDDQLEVV